ncbi:MAG: LysR family transcriptional regulator [Desulfurococcales archaeon]|nr:LysR family transcriptional regulator [Desulfurococcales archaeon]
MGIRVVTRLFVVRDTIVIGSNGLVEILEAVDRRGSLRGAAEELGISYRRLWARLVRAEQLAGERLVERGRGRGGARLTRLGKRIVEEYRRMEGLLFECGAR